MAKRKHLHEKEDKVEYKQARDEQNSKYHGNFCDVDFRNSHSRQSVPDGRCGGTEKRTRLLEALVDLLQSETEEKSHDGVLDEETLLSCRKLLESLCKRNSTDSTKTMSNLTSKPIITASDDMYSDMKISKIPSPSFLSAWTSSSILPSLPPLPAIRDSALEAAAFTHSAMVTRKHPTSYERLEWVGDAYVELISTLLISSTFTTLPPGKSAQLRELIVKNETLASFARQYDFARRARLPPEFSPNYSGGAIKPKDKEIVKVFGDMFEAYVAAVVLSDPQHGVDCVASWLKSLWAKTLSKQIKDQERQSVSAGPTINSKVLLSQRIGVKGVNITYKDAGPETKDPVTGLKLFCVGVYLTGWGEHDKELGIGRALSKKDAGTKAAEVALADRKVIGVYEEQKRLFNERARGERESPTVEADSEH